MKSIQTVSAKMRNSNVEILRIIAMILIVFGHQIDVFHYEGVGGVVDFLGTFPTANPQYLLLSFVGPLGLLGDVIFIACSAFFLLESDRISVKKIFYLIASDVIIMCAALSVKACLGDAISSKQILEAVFPTVLQVNWFVGYYIVFYLLHPLFNYVIRRLDKKGLAIVTGILVFQCNIISFGMGNTPGQLGVKLLCFVSIYFAIAFYKRYGGKLWQSKKFNVALLLASIAAYIALRVALNYVGLRVEYVAERQYGYAHISNPIILVMSMAALNLASRKVRYVPLVNYVAGLSLLLYLTHKNLQVFFHFDYLTYFVDTYGAQHFVGAVFTKSLIVLGLGLATAVLYRHTVYYGVMWLGGKVETAVNKLFAAIRDKWASRRAIAGAATTAEAPSIEADVAKTPTGEAVNEGNDDAVNES